MSTESLYEKDFYAWAQQQADLLRRLPAIGNEIDLEHIAEEIEDLGRSDLRAARSLCQHIIDYFSSNIPGLTNLRIIGVTKSSNGASS